MMKKETSSNLNDFPFKAHFKANERTRSFFFPFFFLFSFFLF